MFQETSYTSPNVVCKCEDLHNETDSHFPQRHQPQPKALGLLRRLRHSHSVSFQYRFENCKLAMICSESKIIVLVLWLAQEVTVRLHCQLLKRSINCAMVLLRSRSVCKPIVSAKLQPEHRFGSGLIYSVQIQTWFSYGEILINI